FHLFAAEVAHGGKGSGGIRRTIEGSLDAEDRGHFDIHRKHLPVTVGDGPSGTFHRHTLLMLPIRSSRELGRLQYLEADQPEQDDAKAGEKKMQQNVSPAPRRTDDYFAPPTGKIVRATRKCLTNDV